MPITWEDVKGALGRGTGRKAGQIKVAVKRVAGPTSYATGGFDVVVEELSEVVAAFAIADGGYLASVDFANSSKNKVRVVAYYFDYDAEADGAAIQAAAGTNLSGVNFTIIAFGW